MRKIVPSYQSGWILIGNWWYNTKTGKVLAPISGGGVNAYYQQAYRFVTDDGSANAGTLEGSGNNDPVTQGTGTDERKRCRIVVEETTGNKTETQYWELWASYDGGAYFHVTTSSSIVQSIGSFNTSWTCTDEDATTARLGYAGSFTTGRWDDDGSVETGVSHNGSYTEVEFCYYLVDADVADAKVILFEVRKSGGGALNGYNQRPQITVSKETLSQVYDDVEFVWDMRELVNDDLVLQWDILDLVYDDLELVWDILEPVTQVNDDLVLQWDIHNIINDDLELVWDLNNTINDDLVLQWDLLNLVNDDTELIWDIHNLATDDIELVWDMRELATDDIEFVWDMAGVVYDDLELVWDILQSSTPVYDDLELVWDIHEQVYDDVEFVWDLLNTVSDDLVLQWDIHVLISDDLELVWDLNNLANDDLELLWDIFNLAADDIEFVWDIYMSGTDTIQFVWDMRQLAYDTIKFKWDLGDVAARSWSHKRRGPHQHPYRTIRRIGN